MMSAFPPPEHAVAPIRRPSLGLVLAALTLGCTVIDRAHADPVDTRVNTDSIGSYISDWFARVDAATASQPGWAAPLTTVTPLVKEFVQYGQTYETLNGGSHITTYDGGVGGVGLHLIPSLTNEVYIGAPPYMVFDGRKPAQGLGDWPAFLIKQRLAAANEANGDYVVTAYLAGQAPIGIARFSANAYTITPTLGLGKGWGDLDLQANISTPLPTDHASVLGEQLASAAALQYHLFAYTWPELEVNDTQWLSGLRGDLNQLFVTPDVILGPMPLWSRLKGSLILGYQFALTPRPQLNPLTPLYNHSWIFALRTFF